MAYYPPEFVERIRLIKQLQEERFMPLRVIRELLDAAGGDPERLRALAETGDALVARALGPERGAHAEGGGPAALRDPRAGPATGSPSSGCSRPTPTATRRPTCASSRRSRASARPGWNETTGFGARDVARLMQGLEPVIADELDLLIERFSALGADRAEAIVEGGASPFPALIGALHAKLLTAELERARGG